MTSNITLRLDQKTINRIKHVAVDRNTSVSAWVGELVRQAVDELDGFKLARKHALQTMARPVQVKSADALTRAQSHFALASVTLTNQ